jgi:hypothetical protein
VAKARKLPVYPADHLLGMRVPLGGSNCAKCEYVNGQKCKQKDFIQWNGSPIIPAPVDEYCCDMWKPAEGVMKAGKRIEDVSFEDAGL